MCRPAARPRVRQAALTTIYDRIEYEECRLNARVLRVVVAAARAGVPAGVVGRPVRRWLGGNLTGFPKRLGESVRHRERLKGPVEDKRAEERTESGEERTTHEEQHTDTHAREQSKQERERDRFRPLQPLHHRHALQFLQQEGVLVLRQGLQGGRARPRTRQPPTQEPWPPGRGTQAGQGAGPV